METAVSNEMNDFFSAPTEIKIPAATEAIQETILNRADFDTSKATTQLQINPEGIVKQITDKEAEISAKTTIGMANAVQRGLLGRVIAWKYEKKVGQQFDSAKLDIIERVIDLPDTDLQPEERSVKARFNKLMAKREKLENSIPFTEVEKKEMTEILSEYYKITGTAMSPNVMLIGAFIDKMGNRVLDVLLD